LITADELLGITPQKTATGRVICNDDPPEVERPPAKSEAMARVKAFIQKAEGEFSAHDIVEECGVSRSAVATYLSRFARGGWIRKVGYLPVGRCAVRMNLWRRA
jgi:response regulator of citrate/malate metabolism